jgi:hypothetical protein
MGSSRLIRRPNPNSFDRTARQRHQSSPPPGIICGGLAIALASGVLCVPGAQSHAGELANLVVPVVPIEQHNVVAVTTPSENIYDLESELHRIPELKKFFAEIDVSRVKIFNRFTRAETTLVVADGIVYSTGVDVENSGADFQSQTSQAPSLNISDTHTVTNTVTKGLKLGLEVTAKQKVDFLVAESELTEKVSVGFDMSWATSTTDTRTLSYVLTPQSVVAPPHTRVLVSAFMQRVRSSGRLVMTGDLVGDVILRKACGGDIVLPVGQLLAMTRSDGSRIAPTNISPQGDTAHFEGESVFSGAIGLTLAVKYDYVPLSSDAPPAKTEIKPVLARPATLAPVIEPTSPTQSTIGRPLSSLTANACPGSGFDRAIENLQLSSADLTNFLDYDPSLPEGAAVKDADTKTHGVWIIAPLGDQKGLFRLLYGRSGLCLAMKRSASATSRNQIFDVVVERCEVTSGVAQPRQLWGLRLVNTGAGSGDRYNIENVAVSGACISRPYPGASAPMVISCRPLEGGDISTWRGHPEDSRWQFSSAGSTRPRDVEQSLLRLSRQWIRANQVNRAGGGQCTGVRRKYSPDRWQYAEVELCAKRDDRAISYTVTLTEFQYKWGGPVGTWYYNRRNVEVLAVVELQTEDGHEVGSHHHFIKQREYRREFPGTFASLQPGEYTLVIPQATVRGMFWSDTTSSVITFGPLRLNVEV